MQAKSMRKAVSKPQPLDAQLRGACVTRACRAARVQHAASTPWHAYLCAAAAGPCCGAAGCAEAERLGGTRSAVTTDPLLLDGAGAGHPAPAV